MAEYASLYPLLLVSIAILCVSADIDRKLYIVYMGSLPELEYSPSSHHLSLLQGVTGTSSVENLLVRSYTRSFNGFAAKLSDYEAQKLARTKEVVSVFPSRTYQLHTTGSWSFMGLGESAPRNPTVESNIIIGVLDTGIWPESESFNDKGFSPPPKHWKGSCQGGKNFTCNNKLIGARFYSPEKSARDDDGHGTHTASTAAGNKVEEASFFGIAEGTARGGVPSARIAAYKICTPGGCSGADILAAFDDAIADGVDIITISVGSASAVDFVQDSIAIGAFHAMAKGILISHSAGNSGPSTSTVSSVAPWVLTVAASSIDRRIIDKVVLGNGKKLIGNSVNPFSLKGENFPLIYGANASSNCTADLASVCSYGCLDESKVKGKIVVCDSDTGNIETERVGATGTILPTGEFEDVSFIVSSPLASLTDEDYVAVKSYINSTRQPLANLLKSEAIKESSAPVRGSFSSQGPNTIVLDLLKPDISAPGIDILAAYPDNISPTGGMNENRRVKFTIMSGTSMSCPHAAGVASYIKTFHPKWSPSMIKSAIMTTAFPMKGSDTEFGYGSGHVNPSKAIHPGLVYEAYEDDYIKMLCSLSGYTDEKVRLIAGNTTICPTDAKKASPRDLNYPSMSAALRVNQPFSVSFHRTVTNVGTAKSTYKANITGTSSKLKIKVKPQVLSFKSVYEKKSFNVSVAGVGFGKQQIVSASIVWSDGTHVVRSPIVVHTYAF